MIDETPISWLAREIGDLLDAGRVGLYEFMEFLSGDEFDLSESSKKEVSVAVARDLVHSGRADLCLVRWPKSDVLDGPFDVDIVLKVENFPMKVTEYYLALIPK